MVDDDAASISAFFSDSGDSNRYLMADWLIGVAFVLFFLPFVSALRSFLGAADPSGGAWARFSFAGGLLILVGGLASSLAYGSLAVAQTEGLDDSTLLFARGMTAYGFGSSVPLGIAALIGPASLIILASGVLWHWLGFFGLVVALLNLFGALWLVGGDQESLIGLLGLLGFVGFGVWTIAASIGMLRADRRDVAGSS